VRAFIAMRFTDETRLPLHASKKQSRSSTLTMLAARLVASFLLIVVAFPVMSQSRHALVVGIDQYRHVEPLRKAVNDARAVANALGNAGFTVDLRTDSDEREMLSALSALENRAQKGDEVVVFFAGHGIEIDGQNYLLPADVPALSAGEDLILRRRSIPVADIVEVLAKREVRVSLLILDACRNNPFPRQGTRSLGATRGLAQVEPPIGTFLVYSAGAGQEALDRLSESDPDPNSIFTRTLLPRLSQPGMELSAMMREVRSEVRRLARSVNHEQFPGVYDQLDGAYFFVPPGSRAPMEKPPETLIDPCAEARTDWDRLGANPSSTVLERFRTAHASCPLMLALADDRLASIQSSSDIEPSSLSARPVNPDLKQDLSPEIDLIAKEALFRDVQRELNRVGCNSGTPDGIWGARTGRALQSYISATGRAGTELPVSPGLLAEIKTKAAPVCLLECRPEEVLKDGQCVPKQRTARAPSREAVKPDQSRDCFRRIGNEVEGYSAPIRC
jgi:uncharacterized caspase-like protein